MPITQQSSPALRGFFTTCLDGLLLMDTKLAVEDWNPALTKLLASPDVLRRGESLFTLLPGWRGTGIEAVLKSVARAHIPQTAEVVGLPGLVVEGVRVHAMPVVEFHGVSRGFLIFFADWSRVVTLERSVRLLERQASVGRLSRGVVHQLNNPLDGVLRYVELALDHLEEEDQPVRDYLVKVHEGLHRMVRAVKGFLQFARQASAPVERPVQVNPLLDDALLLLGHRARFQQVHVVKRFAEDLPLVADNGLQQALVNILQNGFESMPRGGTLTVTTARSGSGVEITVTDTGVGIPDDVRGQIFEPFFTTKPVHQGNGLGLAIAREVVERSQGRIECESRVGVGSTFRILLSEVA